MPPMPLDSDLHESKAVFCYSQPSNNNWKTGIESSHEFVRHAFDDHLGIFSSFIALNLKSRMLIKLLELTLINSELFLNPCLLCFVPVVLPKFLFIRNSFSS